MTHPLSIEDKRRAFIRATKGMSQAAERWAQRAASGLTDEQLAEALKYELGIFGGSIATDNCPALTYQGNGLKIWVSWEITNHVTTKPTFQGAATVAMAREVYGIRDPEDKQLTLF
jgi:hypothetical protein